MPIVRTYGCPTCNHLMEVTLTMAQVDDPPPECPACAARQMQQEFKPFAIGGSAASKANAIAEDIAEKDYRVGNMQRDRHEGATPKVRYNDQEAPSKATWTAGTQAVASAINAGRQTRLKYGSGLDMLQANLKSGAEVDLIEASKKRLLRVF